MALDLYVQQQWVSLQQSPLETVKYPDAFEGQQIWDYYNGFGSLFHAGNCHKETLQLCTKSARDQCVGQMSWQGQ